MHAWQRLQYCNGHWKVYQILIKLVVDRLRLLINVWSILFTPNFEVIDSLERKTKSSDVTPLRRFLDGIVGHEEEQLEKKQPKRIVFQKDFLSSHWVEKNEQIQRSTCNLHPLCRWTLNNLDLFPCYTLKNEYTTQKWRFGRCFSFSIGWFLGSILLFRGVYPFRDLFLAGFNISYTPANPSTDRGPNPSESSFYSGKKKYPSTNHHTADGPETPNNHPGPI